MPRKKASPSDQLCAARKKINAILSKYNGCRDTISIGRSIYRKDKVNNDSFKTHFNDYNVLRKAEKVVRELSTSSSSPLSSAINELPLSTTVTNDITLPSMSTANECVLLSSTSSSISKSNINSIQEAFYDHSSKKDPPQHMAVSNTDCVNAESFSSCSTKPTAQDPQQPFHLSPDPPQHMAVSNTDDSMNTESFSSISTKPTAQDHQSFHLSQDPPRQHTIDACNCCPRMSFVTNFHRDIDESLFNTCTMPSILPTSRINNRSNKNKNDQSSNNRNIICNENKEYSNNDKENNNNKDSFDDSGDTRQCNIGHGNDNNKNKNSNESNNDDGDDNDNDGGDIGYSNNQDEDSGNVDDSDHNDSDRGDIGHNNNQEDSGNVDQEQEEGENEEDNFSNNDVNEDVCCYNCHRQQSNFLHQFGNSYQNEYFEVKNTDLKSHRRFKLCNINYNNDNESHIYCRQCTEHLTCEDSHEANDPEFTWPAFIWWFLSNKNIRKTYQCTHLWKFIPLLWRHWWIEEFKSTISNVGESNNIRLDHPKPFFIDRTCEIEEWEERISTFSLPDLQYACNKYCIPYVACPFGCSTFIFRTGSIGLDIMLQRFLPKYIFRKFITNKDLFKYVESVRDDFIRDDEEYDNWLLNPFWKVRPTIAFQHGVPMILTCEDHHGGTTKLFIHPPRSALEHNLPSRYSDQLAHCSIRTRTIKPMSKKYYSNAFQMHEQRANFNGIDTCNISSYRRFDFVSSLLTELESVAIVNRPDINSLLNQLVDERVMSKETAKGKRNFATSSTTSVDFYKYYYGATYVPFESAMSMHKDLSINMISVTIDNR